MDLPARKQYAGDTRRLLLAFDIGTTFSGISYSILDPGSVPEIRPVTRFPCQQHVGGDSKIPTVVYYDSNGDVCAIGAETLKDGIEEDAEENRWTKARWFKLHLRPKPRPASMFSMFKLHLRSKPRPASMFSIFRRLSLAPEPEPEPEPHESDSIPPLPPGKAVVQVFADYMVYLFECAKEYITETHGARVWASLADDIMYVLTHPNGWGGPQQAQMRLAAITAGLISDTEEGRARVTFVTEGEASLHFCLSNGLEIEGDEGDGVLVVDAGGGTIDLTAYRKLPDHSFEEIAIPKCHFQGAAYVTMRAEQFFRGLLSGTRFAQDIDTLTTRFDRKTKHVFRRDDEPHHIQFASHRERDATLNIRGGRLTLAGSDVATFFEPSISCIIQAVKDQISAAHAPIKTVFLVGGFSASHWLCENVRQGIEPLGVVVSRPDTHVNKAVSNGAVSFYLDGVVSSRVARLTYGVRCSMAYDSTNPEHSKRGHLIKVDKISGKPMLDCYFSNILPKNTRVKETTEFRESFSTSDFDRASLDHHRSAIHCYTGQSNHPRWMNDESDMYSAVCIVKADTSSVKATVGRSTTGVPYHRIHFDVVLLFGLTELKAQIAYLENGVEKRGPATVVYED